MNSQQPMGIYESAGLQDKLRFSTLSSASNQPLRSDKLALKDLTAEQKHPAKKPQSAKGRPFLAAGWVDGDTNAIIELRILQAKKQGIKTTRSTVISDMLKVAAQNDAFTRNQAILTPIIRDTIRTELQHFENRHIALTARIAYWVGQILLLLQSLLRYVLKTNLEAYRKVERESEKLARVNITRRTPQVDEVISRVKTSLNTVN
jgi:hypothetical protein